MSHTYFEAHITVVGDPARTEAAIMALTPTWRFSSIVNDILLGEGIKCYATRHFSSKVGAPRVIAEVLRIAKILALSPDLKVIRRKVERVVFDDRSSKTGKCVGGCVECHLDDQP